MASDFCCTLTVWLRHAGPLQGLMLLLCALPACSLTDGEISCRLRDCDQDGVSSCGNPEADPALCDCDDTDNSINPDAPEVCDFKDNDCDREIDEDDPPQAYYLDNDGDGWGDQNDAPHSLCQPDAQRVSNNLDCDDNNPLKNPGEEEVCDGLDNDCNGISDDNAPPLTWWLDVDGDGYGGEAYSVQQCSRPTGYSDLSGDCNDHDTAYHPGAPETCSVDAIDYNCDGFTGSTDHDEDGFQACMDCNDANIAVYPEASEVCNSMDDDCNLQIDDVAPGNRYRDRDSDSFALDQQDVLYLEGCPIGWTNRVPVDAFSQDCNDVSPVVYPGADELCDLQDNNCDGTLSASEIDSDADGVPACAQEMLPEDCNNDDDQQSPLLEEVCDGIDNDCDELIPANELDLDGDNITECGGDCDDRDRDSFPGAPEICDSRDNNCDGTVDEGVLLTLYPDLDNDGFGVTEGELLSCTPVEGYVHKPGDCDDANPAINPSTPEVLEDDLDNNCDGQKGESQACLYPDFDDDGVGAVQAHCDVQDSTLEKLSTLTGDCDDTKAAIYPGAPESCDSLDNDCDGTVDEGAQDVTYWYPDADGDGYGVTNGRVKTCSVPDGFVATPGDCDDEDSSTHPGAEELPDGFDNDCDGLNESGEIPPESVDVVVSPSGEDSPSDIPGATSLQDAVDIAVGQTSECVTVLVEEGTYRGSLVLEDQCVTLVSVGGAEKTFLMPDASGGSVFQVVRGSLTLKGFTLQGGTGSPGKEGACFEGNTSERAGGGICARDTTLMAGDLILSGNYATHGGELYLQDSICTLTNLRLTGGAGTMFGGGLYQKGGSLLLRDSEISGYSGSTDGAGAYISNGALTLENVTLKENTASTAGGGLYLDGSSQALQLTDVTFVSNTATSQGGGALIGTAGTVILKNLTFEQNVSGFGGGASLSFYSGAKVTATQLGFTSNSTSGNGAGMYLALNGGSISNWKALTFSNNVAQTQGGGMQLSGSPASALLEDLTFDGNSSGTDGGGIYAWTGSNITLRRLTLTDSAASSRGGALYLDGGGTVEDTVVTNAKATNGGGVFLAGSTRLNRLRVTGGRATDGGGLYCSSSLAPVLRNLQVLANEATDAGGGIYVFTDSNCQFYNATVARNWAWRSGGGINVLGAPQIYSSIVAYNGVAGKGSNVFTDSNFILKDSLLYNPPGDGDSLEGVTQFTLENNGILQKEPRFIRDVRYGAAGDLDVHLRPDSPARNMGSSTSSNNDPDGTRNDMGAFGGPDSAATDDDTDGLPDDWEVQYGLNLEAVDAGDDFDGDGMNNADEYAAGLAPSLSDSDGDGVGDDTELNTGTHPLDPFDATPGKVPVIEVPEKFSTVQAALDYAFPNTLILLAPNTYGENLHAAFKTLNLEGEAGRDQTILKGDGSQSVIVLHAMEEGTELRGLTITGGGGSNDVGESVGGGIFVPWSFLSLSNLIISGNSAFHGGGMYQYYSTSTVQHSVFQDNKASYGGGMFQDFGISTVQHSVFQDNTAELSGGGMFQSYGTSTVQHSVFQGNRAYSGGGKYQNQGIGTLTASILTFNTATKDELYANHNGTCPASSNNAYYLADGNSGTPCALSSTDQKVDPLFLDRANGDYHLASTSPLINTGDPSEFDPDGSRADIGLYGGPGADDFDFDGDGFPDYYWPGGYANPPSGETRAFDCDDGDPEVYTGQGC